MTRFKATANVILTFDGQDEDGNSQEFYDAEVNVGYPKTDEDRQRFEVDVVKDLLAPSKRSHDDLVKISVCYSGFHAASLSVDEAAKLDQHLEFLCRNNAKYYFQPNQRDDTEQAIADKLGIAGRTKDF